MCITYSITEAILGRKRRIRKNTAINSKVTDLLLTNTRKSKSIATKEKINGKRTLKNEKKKNFPISSLFSSDLYNN